LPRLREDEKKNAGSFLKQKDNDKVTELLLIHNVHVTLDNIKRLDGDEWLNDCIINIAGLLFQEKSISPDAFIWTHFFIDRLVDNGSKNYDYNAVKKWPASLKSKYQINLTERRRYIFPINYRNTHSHHRWRV
jgi:Ulp1 family protease